MLPLGRGHHARRLRVLLPVLLSRQKTGLPGTRARALWDPRGSNTASQLELRQNNLPHVHDIWYRYDPPVLIVAITWFQTAAKFGKLVYDLLSRSYAGNESSVRTPCGFFLQGLHALQLMWLDITLGGDSNGHVAYEGGDSMEEVPEPAKCAGAFLTEHRSAKILVVVDAHCLENGFLVYAGNSPLLYEACSLGEVSTPWRLFGAAESYIPADSSGLHSERGAQVSSG